jgi:hypothetical protein
MATVTAMVHIGAAHPNDDGLLPSSMKGPIFLQENSRPAWTHLEPHHAGCTLVPSNPQTILEEGLIFVGIRLLGWPLPGPFGMAIYEGGRHDAGTLIPDADARRQIIETAMGFAESDGRKLVISVLHGSSLLSLLPTLEAWPLDVEVLAPAYVRVANRWLPSGRFVSGTLIPGGSSETSSNTGS